MGRLEAGNFGQASLNLEAVLGVRPRRGTNLRGLDVLIQWKGLPPFEATWEPYNMIHQQFPTFHLEDKVKVRDGSNDRPPVKTFVLD